MIRLPDWLYRAIQADAVRYKCSMADALALKYPKAIPKAGLPAAKPVASLPQLRPTKASSPALSHAGAKVTGIHSPACPNQ
jgi:hypothetical protein